ncbi:MAG: outer membrane lipoprotein-sorting protein [Bacteroidales bacterium]|nr:outer membrane lipoprotein-sorting protein [Lentimicrobiaceae bacterium]MDD5694139.1 outer membrane lipoprotein-sorting protein [Bacteroidales bacterium]
MKTSLLTRIFLSFFLLMMASAASTQTLTATEIVRKAQDKVNGSSSRGIMKMTIVRPGWSREVTMKTWSLGTDFSMIYITSPAKDVGQVFLKRDNDMWNWIPSINRMIKIPPSMMGQSWMGSDFTNDDLVKMNSMVDDYQHQITGSEVIDGYECYIIELVPKPEATVVWGKIRVWISKKEYFELRAEYYDEDGVLANYMTGGDIKLMGDRMLPARMVMIPMDTEKEGHETRLEMVEMQFNVKIAEDFFSQQNMKSVR